MRIDISEIAGRSGAFIEVVRDAPTKDITSGTKGVELGDKLHIDLRIEYIEGMITVSGNVTGSYHTKCARCLKDIDEEFTTRIYENFVHVSDMDEHSDDYDYDGGHIDLDAPLIDNILLGFPSIILCQDDCRGLCSVCGKNLNEGDCSCDNSEHEINLQMEKLKDFFDK